MQTSSDLLRPVYRRFILALTFYRVSRLANPLWRNECILWHGNNKRNRCLYNTSFCAVTHNCPICTFNWSTHIKQLKTWLSHLDTNILPVTLTLPNCQVCRQRFKDMSVTTAGMPVHSVSLCSLEYKGNGNAKAKSWRNRKSKRN